MAKVNERILKLRNKALANPNHQGRVFIGKVTKDVGAKIKAKCGRNVTGFEMYIDSNYIRHIKNKRPHWLKDIDKYVLDIIFNAEDFQDGNRDDCQRIVFIRKTDVEYWAVQHIEEKSLLTVTTYIKEWKKKPKKNTRGLTPKN